MPKKLFNYIVEGPNYDVAHLFKLEQVDQPTSLLDGIGPPADTGYGPLTPPAAKDSQTPSLDLILNSYVGNDNQNAVLRFILGKIVTQPTSLGQTSDVCYYTELNESCVNAGDASDVTLVETQNGPPVATNPHGFAQVEDMLYISDYDFTKIWVLGYEALTNPDTTDPDHPFVSVLDIDIPIGDDEGHELPVVDTDEYQYHGNGIMSLKDPEGDWYLFALFIASNNVPTPENPPNPYEPSQLVRIKLPYTGPADIAVKSVGLNAVDMDLTDDGQGNPVLLITAIGRPQRGGLTNGSASMITKVVDIFSDTFAEDGNTTDLLTGDIWDEDNPIGDIRCLAVGDDGKVNILVGYFNDDGYNGFDWKVYRIDKDELLDLDNATISQAVEDKILEPIGGDTGTGGYFWGIVAGADLLILIKGSDMVITTEAAPDFKDYTGDPNPPDPITNVIFHRGRVAGDIGDANMNSLNFTWATMEQILQQRLAGGQPLHHRHHHIRHLAMQAMQAALAAGAAGGMSEETGGN